MALTKAHYQTIFQVAPDGMSISRLQDGLFMDANQSFSEMFGYKNQDLVGKTSYELNFWHNFSERAQIIEKLAKRESIDNFETSILSSEGRRIDVMLSARVIALDSEQCLLLTYKNVTLHTQTMQALRESEKKFKDIFDTSPDGIIVSDSNGLIYDVNKAFETLSGYNRKEIIGKLATVDVGLWEDPGNREDFLTKVRQDGKVQNFEMTALAREGQLKKFLLSAKQIVIKGKPRILSIARDITFIKAAEQNLRKEEQRYRELFLERQTILEAIPDALIIWSDKGEALWANRNAEKYLRTNPDKVIGKTCRELCRVDHEEETCPVHQGLTRAEQVETIEKTSEGETWVVKAYPIVAADGQVVKVMTLSFNITERLRLRDEANRSARLAALGELAAGVAHEINNPTGLVLMNASLVKDVMFDLKPLLDKDVQNPATLRLGGLAYHRAIDALPEALSEIIESGQRIKQIVEDLKDFSRPALQDTFETVDLNEVVRNSLRIMRVAIRQATDTFVVEYQDDLPKVAGNLRQLEQVLVNLLSNACQALQKRSESLVVALYADEARQQVCLKVWDEGCGIETQTLNQITDPFFTTKRESGGTGLGLSISTRIIEEHKGHIHFESTPGYGTTVTVHLPAMTAA